MVLSLKYIQKKAYDLGYKLSSTKEKVDLQNILDNHPFFSEITNYFLHLKLSPPPRFIGFPGFDGMHCCSSLSCFTFSLALVLFHLHIFKPGIAEEVMQNILRKLIEFGDSNTIKQAMFACKYFFITLQKLLIASIPLDAPPEVDFVEPVGHHRWSIGISFFSLHIFVRFSS